MDLAKLVVKLEMESAQFLARAEAAEAKVKRLEAQVEKTGDKLTKNLQRGVVAAVGAFAALTKIAIDGADKLERVSQATGLATETLSGLAYAASLADVPADSLWKTMQKLAVSATEAQDGTGKAAEAFRALKIDVRDANGDLKGQEALLYEVADAFERSADGTAKAAVAQAILGREGRNLIPFLNQGSKALREQTKEAEAFGLIVSSQTAKAADEFNDNLTRLKGAAMGAATTFAADLLPVMVQITDEMVEQAKEGGTLRSFFDLFGEVLKGVASAGIRTLAALENIGRTIGGIAAAATLAADGEFSAALKTMKRLTLENEQNTAEANARIARIWAGELPAAVKEGADKINDAAKDAIIFDPAGAESKAKKAAEAALKGLLDQRRELEQQIATYGMGREAVAKWSAEFGELAEKGKEAGAGGKEAVDSIVALETVLSRLETAKAIEDIDQQIQALTGHTAEAAAKAFDLQNAILRASIDPNDTASKEKLETLRKLVVEQAAYNELELEAEKIRTRLARVEDQIEHSQSSGAINELDAMAQLEDARAKALEDLTRIHAAQVAIADESSNPAIIKAAEDAGVAIDELAAKTELLAEHFENLFEDSAAGPLADFIQGTESAADAWQSFVNNLEASIADFIAKDLLRRAFGGISSLLSPATGGAGGFLGGLTSLVPGAQVADSGPRGMGGRAYMIGTGAQPEWFVPDGPGQFVPAGSGGMNVTNNFTISAPGGQVTRRTEQQIAAAAARGVQMANLRGN